MKQETGQLQVKKQDKAEKPEKYERKEESHEMLIRILSTDIPGSRKVNIGLTYIKGISFSMSNAVCYILKMDKNKKIGELSKEEIERITAEIKNPKVPDYFKNRRNDFDTGETRHLVTTELDLKKEFDIKRMKKNTLLQRCKTFSRVASKGSENKEPFQKERQE